MDRWLITQNIENFEDLLKQPLPAQRRQTVETLLADERRKLAEIDRSRPPPARERPSESRN
jgi:hypothetical protein